MEREELQVNHHRRLLLWWPTCQVILVDSTQLNCCLIVARQGPWHERKLKGRKPPGG